MVLAHESFVLALKHNFGSTNQSCHNASDEDPCAYPESFVRGGPTLQRFFLCLFRGERIQISIKAGHHRPASENGVSLACR